MVMPLLVPSSALIVDDEAHIRVFVRMILAKLGVETFYEAGDVAAARELWKAHRPGLVMLDINMPGRTDWFWCRRSGRTTTRCIW